MTSFRASEKSRAKHCETGHYRGENEKRIIEKCKYLAYNKAIRKMRWGDQVSNTQEKNY